VSTGKGSALGKEQAGDSWMTDSLGGDGDKTVLAEAVSGMIISEMMSHDREQVTNPCVCGGQDSHPNE
jgi:hypothetical protein